MENAWKSLEIRGKHIRTGKSLHHLVAWSKDQDFTQNHCDTYSEHMKKTWKIITSPGRIIKGSRLYSKSLRHLLKTYEKDSGKKSLHHLVAKSKDRDFTQNHCDT